MLNSWCSDVTWHKNTVHWFIDTHAKKNLSLEKEREVNFPIWCINFIAFSARGKWRDTRDVYYLLFDFSISWRSGKKSERRLFWRMPKDFVITARTPNEYYKLLKVCILESSEQQSQEILENRTRSKITFSWTESDAAPSSTEFTAIQIEKLGASQLYCTAKNRKRVKSISQMHRKALSLQRICIAARNTFDTILTFYNSYSAWMHENFNFSPPSAPCAEMQTQV